MRDYSRAGVSDVVTMRITGHKTRSVFDRYNIVSTDDMAAAGNTRASYNLGDNRRVAVETRSVSV